MVDGTDEFIALRNNPALAGMTDEQIRQMIFKPAGLNDGTNSLDFGMQGGQGMNLGGSPSMSAINYGNTLEDPYAYNSMSLTPGTSTDYGMEASNPYMSSAEEQFDYGNVQQYNYPNKVEQLSTNGPSEIMNVASQGLNLYKQVKPIIAGLSGTAATTAATTAAAAGTTAATTAAAAAAGTAAAAGGTAVAGGAGAGLAGSAGLAALAPLAPLALGVGALMYMKHRKKKRREAREAKEEAQYKSRKLEQKQDLIDSNADYMEMASKYNNTYNIS